MDFSEQVWSNKICMKKGNEEFGPAHTLRDSYEEFNMGCYMELGLDQATSEISPSFEKGSNPNHTQQQTQSIPLEENVPKTQLSQVCCEYSGNGDKSTGKGC